jgi:hypothetical protein
VKIQSVRSLCRTAGLTLVGSLTLAAVSTVSQSEKAAAIDLNFNTTTQTQVNTNPFNFNFGPGVSSNVVNYTNVASGIDVRITATTSTGYSFVEHIPNYSTTNPAPQPVGDAAFLYQSNATTTGAGGMTYKMDFFATDGITHNFTTAYTAPDLRFLVYDVDGESTQGEAVRIAKGAGLFGYQVGNTTQALIPTEDGSSYLFSGRDVNVAETNTAGSTILYFKNVNSVTFGFEADTRSSNGSANPVFSAIDGDVSLIGQNSINFDSSGHATPLAGFGTFVSTASTAEPVPEPFTIIGTLIGGTAAFRMRKKLKASSEV